MADPLTRDSTDLSIVIVNRNTRDLLRECLGSIYGTSDALRLDVIVVDNGSSDGSVEMVRESFPQARIIQNMRNTGYAIPNNQGMAVSQGRYVLLLNSDTVVQPYALQRLCRFMEEHPEIGACGPMLRYPNGEIQRSCCSVPSLRTYFARMLMADFLRPESPLFGNLELSFSHQDTVPVEAMLGAAFLVRREVLESVGPLDEQFRIHYNDYDWCRRISEAGWKIYFVHEAEIIHYSQATTKLENARLQLQSELVRNLFAYYRKYYGRSGVLAIRIGMFFGYGVRAALSGALRAVALRDEDALEQRFRLTMVRAAVTGTTGAVEKS